MRGNGKVFISHCHKDNTRYEPLCGAYTIGRSTFSSATILMRELGSPRPALGWPAMP